MVVLLGNGNGTFQAPSANLDPTSNFVAFMSIADFNGDGKLDLALGIAATTGPVNHILLGNGDGTFQSPIVFSNIPGAARIAADFNGDGKADLASLSDQPSGLDTSIYLQGAWPALTPSQTELTFLNQSLGTTSAAQTTTLTNTGTATVTISNIAVVGTHADFFTVTNTCGSTLAPTASCQVSLTFTPAAIGTQNLTLNITDDAPGGLVSILITGTTPPGAVAMVSPVSITFPGQYVGTSGLPQSVTLTNSGTAALSITSVATSSADFGALNTCGNSLAAGASCSVGVFFDPTTSGTRTGTLTITDNASNSPQTITLTGSGQAFSVTPVSASATVSPGQSASYMVSVSPAGGFAQSVSLGCSGAPALSNCSISPGTIALSGSSAGMATVTITTAANGSLPPFVTNWPNVPRFQQMPTILASATTVMLLLLALLWRREQASGWVSLHGVPILAVALLLCLAATLASCGGGSSGGSGGGGTGTQAGTYTVTVTGSFSSGATNLTHAAKLTLVVK